VIGPSLLSNVSSSVEVISKLLNGDYPGIPQLMFPHVDVRDVAQAHVNALTFDGVAGHRFCISQQSFWLREVAQILD
jgi:dihydroflavonol-4-reductase